MSEIEVVASFSSDIQVVVAVEGGQQGSLVVEEVEPIQLALSPTVLPYSNNSQRKVFGFNWGDASPLLIAEIQGVVSRCEVAIVESFDAPSSLSVGIEPDYSDIFSVLPGLTLQQSGIYQQHPLVELESVQQVFLKISPGVGCSSGRGIVTIDWSNL